jgi:protein phosphatase
MEKAVPIIQCPNLNCLSPNPLTNKFCEKCGTPLVKRYLWLLGDWVKNYYRPGELIINRYQVIAPQIVLDTKAGLPSQAPDEFPPGIIPYLKLFPHRLHVPQIYDYVPPPDDRINNMDIWFLDYGTVPLEENGQPKYGNLIPELTQLWASATPLRQLHWLWQMACLWQPLKNQGVAATLLNPALIRVNNRLVQFLQLELEGTPSPNLSDLGKLWLSWLPQAQVEIQPFLDSLCETLTSKTIQDPKNLVSLLDKTLYYQGQNQERVYHIYTATDTGTTREHNEDACYPPPNQAQTVEQPQNSLVVVCDGIGGQDGGEIASRLAIDTLEEQIISTFDRVTEYNPEHKSSQLLDAICTTNNVISERNDLENRQERQRMGTTVVLALAAHHEVYIGHVGDSRVYWITADSCHQITVDDDLASREVRLGYLIYRDATQYPNSGALVQAIGMGNAAGLHPTIGRFIVDEDCVFLLCSDGLSDNDRVEQYWETEIAPLLVGDRSVAEVGSALIRLANEKNGHDNTTIAVVHAQVQAKANPQPLPSWTELEALINSEDTPNPIPEEEIRQDFLNEITDTDIPTEASFPVTPPPRVAPLTPPVSSPPPPRRLPAWVVPSVLGGLLSLGGLGWFLLRPSPPEDNSTPLATTTPALTAGIYKLSAPLTLKSSPEVGSPAVEYPKDTVVRVLETTASPGWQSVEVCLPGTPITTWLELSGGTSSLVTTAVPEDVAKCPTP